MFGPVLNPSLHFRIPWHKSFYLHPEAVLIAANISYYESLCFEKIWKELKNAKVQFAEILMGEVTGKITNQRCNEIIDKSFTNECCVQNAPSSWRVLRRWCVETPSLQAKIPFIPMWIGRWKNFILGCCEDEKPYSNVKNIEKVKEKVIAEGLVLYFYCLIVG